MGDNEESVTSVRRTRSGKVVKTPSKTAAKTATTRRTRKKVVLMEVEVSDDEEVQHEPATDVEKSELPESIEDEKDEPEPNIDVLKFTLEEEMSKMEANIRSEKAREAEQKEEKSIEEAEPVLEASNGSENEEGIVSLDDFAEEVVQMEENSVSNSDIEKQILEDNEVVLEEITEELVEEEEKEKEVSTHEEPEVEEVIADDKKVTVEEKVDKVIDKDDSNEEFLEEIPESESIKEINNAEIIETSEEKQDLVEEISEEITEVEKKLVELETKMDVDNDEETVNSNGKSEDNVSDKGEIGNGLDSLSDADMAECIAEETTKQNGDPDAENISEDELPGVPVAKVPETEEVSDEELPGPKRAELPADTEVVSEDELPTSSVKKEGTKRKLDEGDYDPGSPTSENEAPTKKPALETSPEKEKEEKPAKPKKLPELDKYWKAVNDDPTDFTGWTYLLQYVDQENDMEAAREAYDAFLSHYPYCYGYWRKYADYEKRKGNKKKCEEVFERGLKSIPLSVDLWIHYLTYVKGAKPEDEEYVRSQFERALLACGLEFRSDRLWDSYIKWETEGKRLQRVTAIYDRLLATPTQGYTSHFDNFQEHIASNSPNKVVEVDEFLALRKEVRHLLKHDNPEPSADSDAPPGDEDSAKLISSDEETKSIRERIVSIRRKIHKNTVNAVTARWNFEEGIKRPYFHVKPLERCQLKNWQDYLDYEIEQGDKVRAIVLFERCLIACALYEEFWLKFVHYLEGLKDSEQQSKIRDVYERACTIHHLKKPNLHLQWAMFEESVGNFNRSAEILVNLEKSVPNVLQVAYRRINLERRRVDYEKCTQLFEHYITSSKNKMISSNISIKYSRFCLKVLKDLDKSQEVLKTAITKDPNNPRLYLQLIDLTLQKQDVTESEIVELIDSFLDKETTDIDQKVLFAQRKLEFLEDFGGEIQSVQMAYDQYQKLIKLSKENIKKKESKSAELTAANKKDKGVTPNSSQSGSYGGYNYGTSSSQPSYPYSGNQQGQYNYSQYGQGDQYQYQNWQYPQGGYGGYNQWGSYSGGYGY